jgi:iron(III) transport system permease protein
MAGVLYVLFAVFVVWPIVSVVRAGFVGADGRFTVRYVGLVFEDPALVRGLLNAAGIAVAVTLVTLAIGMPLAVWSVRYRFPGKGLLAGLLLVPLVIPPFVGAIGVRLVLSRFGPLTQIVGGGELGIDWLGKLRVLGVIGVEVIGLLPIMLLNLQAGLANIDPAMEQAAANLGAGRWRVFRRVTFPLMRPGVFAGCTLVGIWSFTELGTPLMFELYTVTPVQLFERLTDAAASPVPFALVVVMMVASGALYLVGKVLLGRGYGAGVTKASVQGQGRKLAGWRAWGVTGVFVGVVAVSVVPHVAVVLTSLCETGAWYRSLLPTDWTGRHYLEGLRDELAFPSIRHSLVYSSAAVMIAMVVGVMAAVVIVRSRVRGRGLIDALAMLPLAVPGVVLAFGYLAMSVWAKRTFGESAPFFLNVQEWPVGVLVVAYAVRRLPYVVRAAAAGLEQTPVDLELAGANLGASRATVMRRVTVPLIAGNLVAGALLAFAYSMLEVSDSLILAQRMEYYPITKAIWELAQRLGDGVYIASALGVWAMVLLTLTILAANSLLGKRMGAVFRV